MPRTDRRNQEGAFPKCFSEGQEILGDTLSSSYASGLVNCSWLRRHCLLKSLGKETRYKSRTRTRELGNENVDTWDLEQNQQAQPPTAQSWSPPSPCTQIQTFGGSKQGRRHLMAPETQQQFNINCFRSSPK